MLTPPSEQRVRRLAAIKATSLVTLAILSAISGAAMIDQNIGTDAIDFYQLWTGLFLVTLTGYLVSRALISAREYWQA